MPDKEEVYIRDKKEVYIRQASAKLTGKKENLYVVQCSECGAVSGMMNKRDALDRKDYHFWNCKRLRNPALEGVSNAIRSVRSTNPL